jgi:hypothetical protein
VIVVVAVISISATGVAALTPDGDESIHTRKLLQMEIPDSRMSP